MPRVKLFVGYSTKELEDNINSFINLEHIVNIVSLEYRPALKIGEAHRAGLVYKE